MNSKRFFMWGGFIVVIALVIWGLIAAEKKSNREQAQIAEPDVITSLDHIKGDPNAPVTLLEYGDFQCPACAQYHPLVEEVLEGVGSSTVRFVFRHFPLSQHKNAMPSSLAAEAAGDQGKFYEMYNLLYERQVDWENVQNPESIFEGYASELGLDIIKFRESMKLSENLEKINNDYKSGLNAGVKGTPTLFINGKIIENPRSYEEFKNIIEEAARNGETS